MAGHDLEHQQDVVGVHALGRQPGVVAAHGPEHQLDVVGVHALERQPGEGGLGLEHQRDEEGLAVEV